MICDETEEHVVVFFVLAHGWLDRLNWSGSYIGGRMKCRSCPDNLVGPYVRARFWLVPAEIPRDREAMRRWFLEQRVKLDRLVAAWNQEPGHA